MLIATGIYLDILYVILLSILAGLGVTGIMFARRTIGVFGKRAQIQGTKMDIELDGLKHQRAVNQHKNHSNMLQLTAGPPVKEKPMPADIPAEPLKAEPPEKVSVKKHHILEPLEKIGWRDRKEAMEAPDAEFS